MKILILASNPRKDLNLDVEIRELKNVIEKSRNREEFEIVDELAVRVGDLQELLLRHQPQIVHFCGHGGGEEGLVFLNDNGMAQAVGTEALSNLFGLIANIQCILLNACYSEVQANAIVKHINYVIGMNQAIRDDAAIAFSKGFYLGLGYGLSIEKSFDLGCNAVQLAISSRSIERSAISETERKAEVVNAVTSTPIPENLQPILNKKPNLVQPELTQSEKTHISHELISQIHLEIDQLLSEEKLKPVDQPHRCPLFLNTLRVTALISVVLMSSIVIRNQLFPPIVDPRRASPTPNAPTTSNPEPNQPSPSSTPKINNHASIPQPQVNSLNKLSLANLKKEIKKLAILKQEHYAFIEETLDQKNFKDADEATYYFMQTLANKPDSALGEKDIRGLPCHELALIDRLWQLKSGGRFGFTAQKQIYLKLKGIRGSLPVTERWGNAVGWVTNGQWNRLGQLQYNTTAPFGHLPVGGVYVSFSEGFKDRQVSAHLEMLDKCMEIQDSSPAKESPEKRE